MNQIICTSNSNIQFHSKPNKKKFFYKILFYILFAISFISFLYYLFFRYSLYTSEKVSKSLLSNFNITSLYNTNSSYKANFVALDTSFSEGSTPKVIGVLEIKKLDITYPILSEINKDALKISPCRFYGPYPNEVGNLCIAAHNYKNSTFFSNLSSLVNGDIIRIYDTNNFAVDYFVYQVYTTSANDLSCIRQDTNNLKVITLITCDALDNKYRNIVKAKEL